VTFNEVFFLKFPGLLTSAVPFVIILLLSTKMVPLFYILALSIAMCIILQEKSVFTLIPVFIAIMVWGADKIIMKKVNILKGPYFAMGIIIYVALSCYTIIFLKNMQKIIIKKNSPRVLMSVYKGPTVTISGNIIIKDYDKGLIDIKVLSKALNRGQFIIALKKIPEPGFYEISVPEKIGKVYVIARDLDTERPSNIAGSGSSYRGAYAKNPIRVDSQDIRGIDIDIMRQHNIY
jgi:hypothetical protein